LVYRFSSLFRPSRRVRRLIAIDETVLKISCGAAIAVQKITGLTLNLQDSLVYSYKPPNPSGRPEEGREPVNQYPDLFP
jgi:hypothetical protein